MFRASASCPSRIGIASLSSTQGLLIGLRAAQTKTFGGGFRVQFSLYLELVEKCKSFPELDRFGDRPQTKRVCGVVPVPLELLLMGTLAYLGGTSGNILDPHPA